MKYLLFSILITFFGACNNSEESELEMPDPGFLQLTSIHVGAEALSLSQPNNRLPLDAPIVIRFNKPISTQSAQSSVLLSNEGGVNVDGSITYLDQNRTLSFLPQEVLSEETTYILTIRDALMGAESEGFLGIQVSFTTSGMPLEITQIKIDNQVINFNQRIQDIRVDPLIELTFSEDVSAQTFSNHTTVELGSLTFDYSLTQLDDRKITLQITEDLYDLRKHRLRIDADLAQDIDKDFEGYTLEFFTALDTTPKFPTIDDEELLSKVQQQTFKYFWDFGHPISGLSRERITSTETVTSGGSGFGLMTIIVGIERAFISREDGLARLNKIVDFLEKAERFHGVWSHWLNGSTGKVIPFGANDDGGDLVETSYLAMGLLSVRQYLDPSDADEQLLIAKINNLWEGIEWNWHTQGDQSVLYWHWSPNFAWGKNLRISGYNEALITYILAASSPTYPITAEVYHNGWARNGSINNGNTYFDILLPLGNQAMGGPLFFEQYTFLGIDPRNLSDRYANYWEQAVNHTLINRAYCIDNPKNYIGYGDGCWGLTASDGDRGYSAHSPTNDKGVITPTAALSSFPYTPEASMKALHHFYYTIGDRIWKEYGFVDAFNFTEQWVAQSFLAIDQGPIIIMIENYRTGLLWELFMSAPEVQEGLNKLDFNY